MFLAGIGIGSRDRPRFSRHYITRDNPGVAMACEMVDLARTNPILSNDFKPAECIY
jgi:hypothetical protein